MKRIFFLILCFCGIPAAPAGAAEDVYRWVDERGAVHYGEKPPNNKPAKIVDTRPAALSVDVQGRPIERAMPHSGPAAQQPAAQPYPVFVPVPAPPTAQQESPVRGMEFSTFTRLQHGMSEGEVLLRAGKPDHESIENFRNLIVKSLYYYPTVVNPYITVVTLRGGRIAEIERTRKTF
jgi:hypothetical protein